MLEMSDESRSATILQTEMYWRMALVVLQKKYKTVPIGIVANALAILIWEASGILEVVFTKGHWRFRAAPSLSVDRDREVLISCALYKAVNSRLQRAEAKTALGRPADHKPWE